MSLSIPTPIRRWLAIFGFLALAVLVIGNPRPLAGQKNAQPGLRVEIEEGKTARSTLSINNRCKAAHQFRVENKVKYLRFEQPTQATAIGPASTAPAFRPIRIRILFKWHGFNPRSSGCVVELNICIIFGFSIADTPLTQAEVAAGFGTADWQVERDRLHMVFHRSAALPDGTIRIDDDKKLEPEVARALGYESITLKAGTYRVDMSKEQFGEAFVDISKETIPPPNPRQSDVPKFEISPQFSFLSLNRPQSIIVGHTDVGGIVVGHSDSGGIIVGHSDSQGIIVGHFDSQGIVVGHTDQSGIGARFTYNATRNVALETAANFFPKRNPDLFVPGGRIFQMQFGVKVGKRFEKFGIFGKARPGLIRFSAVNRLVDTRTFIVSPALPPVVVGLLSSEGKTYFSAEVGGGVEFYPSRRIVVRFDLGDTIIRYGARAGFSPSSTIIQLPAETKHNFQFSAGVGFRF